MSGGNTRHRAPDLGQLTLALGWCRRRRLGGPSSCQVRRRLRCSPCVGCSHPTPSHRAQNNLQLKKLSIMRYPHLPARIIPIKSGARVSVLLRQLAQIPLHLQRVIVNVIQLCFQYFATSDPHIMEAVFPNFEQLLSMHVAKLFKKIRIFLIDFLAYAKRSVLLKIAHGV